MEMTIDVNDDDYKSSSLFVCLFVFWLGLDLTEKGVLEMLHRSSPSLLLFLPPSHSNQAKVICNSKKIYRNDPNINSGGYDTLNYSRQDYRLTVAQEKILEDTYAWYSSISFDARIWNTTAVLQRHHKREILGASCSCKNLDWEVVEWWNFVIRRGR